MTFKQKIILLRKICESAEDFIYTEDGDIESKLILKLLDRLDRYEKCLQWYADYGDNSLGDSGALARKALSDEEI